ncbi:MAG: DUF488 domain-containing protein, partial [Thermoplasmata archaeon]|nr:DUF488 domain-containing protein [Thermoplasmata archaeon]
MLLSHSSNSTNTCIISLGYEKRSPEQFMSILMDNHIQLLVDVRRDAVSRRHGYSKKSLQEVLSATGIGYLHIPELGISKESRRGLSSKADYQRLFLVYRESLSSKAEYLETLIRMASENRTALLCYERDPEFCHRGVLTDVLGEMGFSILEI